ncbi:MAG: TRAP transporter substrate-binding protein DctP [Treponema sp.]|jgi:TRAP-type C4-dicarboxylate transport system substrate-binding protein|nr:TRAP transporter substrate-binding protein DctP [Treponema sp.]
MKTTKRLLLSLLVMVVAGGMVCAAGSRQAEAKIIVTFAGTEAVSTGQSRMMQEAADKLNATGRFDALVQVNGALANNTDDLVTQAKTGVPLVVPSDPGRLASQFNIPDLNILLAPYVLTDPAVLDKLPDTAIFKEWQNQLEQQGITFIADMYNGFRSFYTTTPVSTVADLRGLRIRGFANNIGNALAKYLGFANIGISWGEVSSAIQQNALDGCEVQAAAVGSAIYEIAKYLALTKHYMHQTSFVCSKALLNKMPEADRKVFLDTIRETARKYGQIIANEEAGYYQQMKDQGVTITEVNLAEFQAAIAPLYANNDLNFSDGLQERLFRELGL